MKTIIKKISFKNDEPNNVIIYKKSDMVGLMEGKQEDEQEDEQEDKDVVAAICSIQHKVIMKDGSEKIIILYGELDEFAYSIDFK